ncbi:hypothetical protein GCM10010954_16660 [Halobacillus andaensis]|uniref:Uncharacterized protein n=1 Tax=Halobacillus andaensis TaxID=1176239 RepID=A0A917B4Q0_HALAA|nr:hypothetical protein [Halobacillus andaensis]MBP2004833.1 hypothetical protein [Halobacillus andaensis]GGF18557.1 hypothetical protein GCM10010954_16660 [Halobacillus andaensis]
MFRRFVILFLAVFIGAGVIDYVRFEEVNWVMNVIQAFFFALVYVLMLKLFGGSKRK